MDITNIDSSRLIDSGRSVRGELAGRFGAQPRVTRTIDEETELPISNARPRRIERESDDSDEVIVPARRASGGDITLIETFTHGDTPITRTYRRPSEDGSTPVVRSRRPRDDGDITLIATFTHGDTPITRTYRQPSRTVDDDGWTPAVTTRRPIRTLPDDDGWTTFMPRRTTIRTFDDDDFTTLLEGPSERTRVSSSLIAITSIPNPGISLPFPVPVPIFTRPAVVTRQDPPPPPPPPRSDPLPTVQNSPPSPPRQDPPPPTRFVPVPVVVPQEPPPPPPVITSTFFVPPPPPTVNPAEPTVIQIASESIRRPPETMVLVSETEIVFSLTRRPETASETPREVKSFSQVDDSRPPSPTAVTPNGGYNIGPTEHGIENGKERSIATITVALLSLGAVIPLVAIICYVYYARRQNSKENENMQFSNDSNLPISPIEGEPTQREASSEPLPFLLAKGIF